MIQQQLLKNYPHDNLYNFMEYKKKKPFFKNPVKITIGYPINNTYHMVKNIVYKEKQILALKTDRDSDSIVLVEAKIENGQLTQISRLPEEFLGNISQMLMEMPNAL